MKKISGYFFLAFAFSLFVGMTSCKKGDTGPAGPAGEQGDKGDKGDPGAANVIYSGWLDTEFGYDTTYDEYGAEIEATEITKEVLSSGMVKIYFNLGTPDEPHVVSLPYFDGGVYIREVLAEGYFTLFSNINVSSGTDSNGDARYQVRYVVVPGGVAARSTNAVNWSDYAQVKKYLGLKD